MFLINVSSGFKDSTLIREKVTSDIFREAGVPAAQTAFYRVYINHGEGPLYFGLYTMVEIPDEPMFSQQFSETDGTCTNRRAQVQLLPDMTKSYLTRKPTRTRLTTVMSWPFTMRFTAAGMILRPGETVWMPLLTLTVLCTGSLSTPWFRTGTHTDS
ncbi:MAG: hypothetical protein GY749_50745 [Desulfobacteraceae bacterium]|nr:hypothetical protein [Desulfobacteraceae bacterium]